MNTSEIKYRIEKMQKVTKNKIGSKDKMMNFKLIANIIANNWEEASWVVGFPRVTSQQTTKQALNLRQRHDGCLLNTDCVPLLG